MEPTILHGKSVAECNCNHFCTNFETSSPPSDICKFCDHDISEHVNLAIVNGDGTIILLPGADSYPESVMTSVPSTVRKERTFQFSRAALYSPNITGTIFKRAKFRIIHMY
jgi:hypothetical protein